MQQSTVSISAVGSLKNSQRSLPTHDGVLSLSLRSLDLSLELSGYPDDGQKLFDWLVSERNKTIEAQYKALCLISRLKALNWKPEGFKTLDEVLAELGLPSGRTLGKLNLVIECFSRETILLAGFEPLAYLLMISRQRQRDKEKRQEAVAGILQTYCDQNSEFSSGRFYRLIAMKYPPAKKRVKKQKACPKCAKQLIMLTASLSHIERLERFIVENLGKQFVPSRPSVLV